MVFPTHILSKLEVRFRNLGLAADNKIWARAGTNYYLSIFLVERGGEKVLVFQGKTQKHSSVIFFYFLKKEPCN